MSRKPKVERVILTVNNGELVHLDYEEKGYYLGSIDVTGVNFHVEAIEVTVKDEQIIKNGKYAGVVNVIVKAKNPAYQNRIDNWQDKNESCTPQLISFQDEGVKYFVHIEVYAA
jgi:hypothetical protein